MNKQHILVRLFLVPLFILLADGAAVNAATVSLPANDSLAAAGTWANVPYCYSDDALYTTGAGAANGQKTFRVGLADPSDTVDMRITSVVLYAKGYSGSGKGKIQLVPFFNGTTGTASANLKFGRTEVTRSFDISAQRAPWHWSDVVTLSVQFRPRTATAFSVNAIFAVVTSVDTAVAVQRHYFVFSTIASPETLGLQFPVVIRTLTTPGDTVMTAYNGAVSLSDSTGSITPVTAAFTAGVCSTHVMIAQDTAVTTITVEDGDTAGTSNAFAVINPGLHHFGIDSIPGINNSQPWPIAIEALDFYGDTVLTWAGQVDLWDATATLTPDSSGDFAAGVWSGQFNVTGLTPPGGDTVFCSFTQGSHTYYGKSNAFVIVDGVAGAPAAPTLPSTLSFRVNPNPARQRLGLDITNPQAGMLQVTLFNILGQVVMARAIGAIPAGNSHVALAVPQGTMPGVYFVAAMVGERLQNVQKVIIIK